MEEVDARKVMDELHRMLSAVKQMHRLTYVVLDAANNIMDHLDEAKTPLETKE